MKPGKRLFHLLWILPLALSLFFAGRFFWIYVTWKQKEESILNQLVVYKKQLDYLRSPLPTEELAGEVTVGTVSLPTRVYDRNGHLIGEYFHEKRSLIPIGKLDEHVKNALISSEDRDFYNHKGVNFSAILRAFAVNLIKFRFAQGGSTITQQLAKVLFTSAEKSLDRKIFEFFTAREIEVRYTKDEILEMYLNLVYMGHGQYGIESASHYYFGKSAKELTTAETAMIIGILPNPGRFSPLKSLKTALLRQKLVLSAMVEMNYLTAKEKEKEIQNFYKDWGIRKGPSGKELSYIGNFPDTSYNINLAPFFLDHIRQQLLKRFSLETIRKGGLRVHTTLDYRRQLHARKTLLAAVEKQKAYYEKQIAALQKKGLTEKALEMQEALKLTNGAFITFEPKSGYILTMVGGSEFSAKNQYNRALKAERQIGSLMKPFVYYLAVTQKEITPATLLEDKELKVGKYSYDNYDHKYLGKITAREALRRSRNTTAVRLLREMGVEKLRALYTDVLDESATKIAKRIPREYGVALGTPSFTPLEMAQMYGALANQGRIVKPRTLLRIEDSHGKILWEDERNIDEVQVLDPVGSYITMTMLQGVFEEGGTAGWVERLRNGNENYLNFDIAGKTGTTSDYNDAWFAGMTSDEVSIVWIGTDNNASLGPGRSGGSLCAPVWVNYIAAIRNSSPPEAFRENWPLPGTIEESFCADTGAVPQSETSCPKIVKNQIFFEGTEPRTFDSRLPNQLPDGAEDLLEK